MRRQARQGLPATNASALVPAPNGGLNTVTPAASMPATEAVQLFNLIPSEFGLRSRLGYREWANGEGDADATPSPIPPTVGFVGEEVRTVIPFAGATPAQGRLFVTTRNGIWDVTASTVAPTLMASFPITTGRAGHGISHVAVTGGGHFALYTDEENGLYRYSAATADWIKVTNASTPNITGVDPGTFVFVTVWKNRVLYVEKNTTRAWHTAVGQLFGAVTAFDFAQRFRAGGHLVGLWNWTYDGGAGVDDSLVGISGGGDVVIYQGTDIGSASTFGLKGVWTLGASPPAGRRIATDWGGELLLLSRTGVLPISRLVTGGDEGARFTTAKVANLFNAFMLARADSLGWSLRIHPEDNCLMVTVPTAPNYPTEQLVMALANRGWSRYRGLPILSSEVWNGKLFFGTTDGRVMVNDGYVDARMLADVNAFSPVQWAVLTSFQSLGDGRHKRVELVRPSFLGEVRVTSFNLEARYRYDFTEVPPVSGAVVGGGGSWDDAIWDTDVWAGDNYVSTQAILGATGVGVEVAIAMRGQAQARTIVVGWDVLYASGGWL